MPPKTGEIIEAMLASGTLAKLAAAHPDQPSFCAAIGVSPAAYRGAVARIRRLGRHFPSFEDLPKVRIPELGTEFDDEPTHPGIDIQKLDIKKTLRAPVSARESLDASGSDRKSLGLWPAVAAFDAEEDPPLPAMGKGFHVRGVSTLVDADGQTRAQWIKTSKDDSARAEWLEAIRSLVEPMPRFDPVPAPEHGDGDLLTVFPVGDPHLGQMSWHEDAGADFDLKIAERNLVSAFEHLIALAPASHEALIIFIGDNTHSDGQANTTTKGTRVDVDSRTIKMMRATVNTARRSIDLALAKHGRVTMIVERGNHDELLSAMLALSLSLLYENEPRVTIDTSPEMFHWYRFGANLIGTHHGDKAKPMDLLGVMACDRQKDWGETKHRRFYCGHLHHLQTKEVPGVVIETLPTLASSDAWHRSMGYRSGRAMYMDVFHREWGHINRHIVGIQQVVKRAA